MKKIQLLLVVYAVLVSSLLMAATSPKKNALVLQTDFGLKDGAVSAMKGVAFNVDNGLPIFDITHEIPVFDIWAAAYRLEQTIEYWPKGTVFVSVVDPGVGTERKSIVVETSDGKYIVTPDNGTVTLIADSVGIKRIREIDETKNRLKGSNTSYTFHGRDVYSYTGARLAANIIEFKEVGPLLKAKPVLIGYQKADIVDGKLSGTISILDVQYGNVWTNISSDLVNEFGMKKGKSYAVKIYNKEKEIYSNSVLYVNSFGDVPKGEGLLYLNSLLNLSVALNWSNFAEIHSISSGSDWKFEIEKK